MKFAPSHAHVRSGDSVWVIPKNFGKFPAAVIVEFRTNDGDPQVSFGPCSDPAGDYLFGDVIPYPANIVLDGETWVTQPHPYAPVKQRQ